LSRRWPDVDLTFQVSGLAAGSAGPRLPGRARGGPVAVAAARAEYDDLRASGEAFAAALALAGVDVRQVQARTMLHGFLNLPASLEPVRAALDLIADTVTET
jgi:acetyl esterase/lipase